MRHTAPAPVTKAGGGYILRTYIFMNGLMFDLSFAEILAAGLAAVIAVKPEDMPGFLRGCGKKLRDFRAKRAEWSRDISMMLDADGAEYGALPRKEYYRPEGSSEWFERYPIESGKSPEKADIDPLADAEEDGGYIDAQAAEAEAKSAETPPVPEKKADV